MTMFHVEQIARVAATPHIWCRNAEGFGLSQGSSYAAMMAAMGTTYVG